MKYEPRKGQLFEVVAALKYHCFCLFYIVSLVSDMLAVGLSCSDCFLVDGGLHWWVWNVDASAFMLDHTLLVSQRLFVLYIVIRSIQILV